MFTHFATAVSVAATETAAEVTENPWAFVLWIVGFAMVMIGLAVIAELPKGGE